MESRVHAAPSRLKAELPTSRAPELPVAPDVAVPWDIAYFIVFLKPKLGEHHAEFLTALVAALNDRAKLPGLKRFPEWKNQPPIPLDSPWPNTP